MDDSAVPEEEVRVQLAKTEATLATLRGALHALPDGVVLVDIAGRITDINPAALHMTGWTEAEALGQALHDVVQLRDAQGREVQLLGSGSKGGRDATTLVRRDRHQLLVDASFASVLDDARRPVAAVVTFRNVTMAKRITDELAFQATHDPLTGVLNRRAFESRLERAVTHAAAHGTPHALLFLDLDQFKAVNDTAGHFAGDELLRALSALLQRNLREHDTLARLGGDEFAMLLEHCLPKEADVIAERIRAAVAAFRFHWQSEVYAVGASIGLVVFHSGVLSPQALLLRADEMCYVAKAGGRNQVQASSADRRMPHARGATPRREGTPVRR